MKTLCDLYGVAYRTSLRDVFSSSYDLYLRLREEVDARVSKALNRDNTWRRKNACSACTYQLENEEKLIFKILVTMDGNDSLKRIVRRALKESQEVDDEDTGELAEGDDEAAPGISIEREDGRKHQGPHYLSREAADKFEDCEETSEPTSSGGKSGGSSMEDEEDSPCEGRWQNMDKGATERAWGIFDETGIFLCLCRHGFVLALLDMVRSGEL